MPNEFAVAHSISCQFKQGFPLFYQKTQDLEFYMTQHLRLNGIYWATTALDLMNQTFIFDRQEIITTVLKCQHEKGQFSNLFVRRF